MLKDQGSPTELLGRPLALVRGPANRPFIGNWVEASARVAQTSQLLMLPREKDVTPAARAVEYRSRVPGRVFQRSGRLQSWEARLLGKAIRAQLGSLPDLLHTHFYSDARLVMKLAQQADIRHIHTEHSSGLLRARSDISGQSIALMRDVFRSADVVIAVSEAVANRIVELAPTADVRILPNPVVIPRFTTVKLGSAGVTHVAVVGNLINMKRPLLALEAFHIFVSGTRTDAASRLHFLGGGPLETELRSAVGQLGLAERVTFHGEVPHSEAMAILNACDVLLHCARAETFGVAIAEAAMMGKPVVATPCGGVVADLSGVRGLAIVEEETPGSIAEALSQARTQGHQAELRRIARTRYGLDRVAAQLAAVYG
jgi:glycosyltransferase involved in cell wall biosynthesis